MVSSDVLSYTKHNDKTVLKQTKAFTHLCKGFLYIFILCVFVFFVAKREKPHYKKRYGGARRRCKHGCPKGRQLQNAEGERRNRGKYYKVRDIRRHKPQIRRKRYAVVEVELCIKQIPNRKRH